MIHDLTHFIIDMDGVLWRGDELLPGFHALFETLRQQQRPFILATNNASRTPAHYVQKFTQFGVPLGEEEVLTSAEATGEHILHTFGPETAVYVCGDDGLHEAIRRRGMPILTVEEVQNGRKVDVVTMGFSRRVTYPDLAAAALAVHRGATFIGSNSDATYPSEYGPLPGAGSLLAVVETATGVKPQTIGKPHPPMFIEAMRRMNAQPATTAMIGDRLNTDIVGGHNVGCRTILVLSGITQPADLEDSQIQPDFIFSGIDQIVEALRDSAK